MLLTKVIVEYVPRFGQDLIDAVETSGQLVGHRAKERLAQFYPVSDDGAVPVAYIWARTINCEGPACGQTLPLLGSLWLSKKPGNSAALSFSTNATDGSLDISIIDKPTPAKVGKGTSAGGAATCPLCGFTTPVESVRRQLSDRRGGAADSRLVAVAVNHPARRGQSFRLPTAGDLTAVRTATEELAQRRAANSNSMSLVPDETITHLRGFINVVLYGITTWGDMFSPRQQLALSTFAELIRELGDDELGGDDSEFREAVRTCLALLLDRLAVRCTANCVWDSTTGCIMQVFNQGQSLPMRWEFAEMNPCVDAGSGWTTSMTYTAKALQHCLSNTVAGSSEKASATAHPLADDMASAVVTDPPYYAAVPYADLSDFFYTWLKRSLGSAHSTLMADDLAPKNDEIVALSHRSADYPQKDFPWFEEQMEQACREARRVCAADGIGVFVFANKETNAWEAMLSAVIRSGWVVTASWPIDTESTNRLRAKNSAALASSVHIVCRPRENPDGSVRAEIGDWRDVLGELPVRIHEWMPRLAEEGVVGADAIFACLGPALEIFSRYSSVEKASGEQVTLGEYLEEVWAAISREALSMIFEGGDASGFEEDSRLTAMWLWTLHTSRNGDEAEARGVEKSLVGYDLEYDAARKIAQGLGAHLENLTHLVEVKGHTATLLTAGARTKYLFGTDGADQAHGRKKTQQQMTLDFAQEIEELEEQSRDWARGLSASPAATLLDQLHQSMILFGAGRGEAVRRFLVEDGVGQDPHFWSLAQALSALYPAGTDEKRWVDGVLARKKGLGL